MGEVLGEGAFGVVLKAEAQGISGDRHSTSTTVAVKTIKGQSPASACCIALAHRCCVAVIKKASPYSITQRRIPELIPVLGSQHAGDVSHKPGGTPR